ncbi:acetyl-CoA carboxylase biotin carboxyl carrier protein [Sinisalibacter aestuarii]|uniref:Biotin carboxyl carrier protein of acetyl-CoA carboxylase n=1 Tax=Sinisalibacter aestuarii TaxID=2949426 RepID=A0ABQ5M0L8_9RHOB|nr:biotin/lipoyl-containing protein [Sinisalibacter aestuarii]GKY90127.1 hypothetical protein STA1M1_39960 [Sinisalibacter aestuarii]
MSSLTRADLEEIMHLLDASNFNSLKLEMGELKLELRRAGADEPAPPAASPAPTAAPAPAAPPAAAPARTGTEIPAPLLGTFYHAPKPGADPFVKVGDRVTEDSVIGIIEVMKLMNSVAAGVSGTVTEITAPNGALVEHGQCLIRVAQD